MLRHVSYTALPEPDLPVTIRLLPHQIGQDDLSERRSNNLTLCRTSQ